MHFLVAQTYNSVWVHSNIHDIWDATVYVVVGVDISLQLTNVLQSGIPQVLQVQACCILL